MGLEAEVPEGLAATRLLKPLLLLPLPQWQDLQNHGGGGVVHQAAREAEYRDGAEKDGKQYADAEHNQYGGQ